MENILSRRAFELFFIAEVPDEKDVQLDAFPHDDEDTLASEVAATRAQTLTGHITRGEAWESSGAVLGKIPFHSQKSIKCQVLFGTVMGISRAGSFPYSTLT